MPKVLMAEDGRIAMSLGASLFDAPSIELDVETDGRSALDRLAEAPKDYDLVVVGFDLPEISGTECIAFIQKMLPRMPILVLSEDVGEGRLRNLADLGVKKGHVLARDATPEAFSAWVKNALPAPRREG